jgi:PAS domain S-box-containing protein
MKSAPRLVTLFLFLLCGVFPITAEISNPLRVALVLDIYPVSFLDKDGKPDGIFPRIIMEIARQNNVRLEWSTGTWGENLERTKIGEIDLMIGLIHTEERDTFLDFGKEAVMSTWSQVFQAAEGDVNSILDIEGRRIGMVSGDQNARGFVNLAESFNLDYEAVIYSDFEQIHSDLMSGALDAGVFFSLYQLSKPDLVPTSIIYQPNYSYFAIPEGDDPEILELIDRSIASWRSDKDSFYYEVLNFFLRPAVAPELPSWLKYVLFGALLIIASALLWLRLLRQQVRQRTAALLEVQEVYRTTFFQADVGICHVDTEGYIIRVNPAFCLMLGYDEQTLLKKRLWEITHPEDLGRNSELFNEVLDGSRTSYKIDKRYLAGGNRTVWGHLTVSGIRDKNNRTQYMIGIVEDITVRRNAENQIEDLEKRYRGVFENSYQLTALFDNVGRLVDFNNTLKRLFHISNDAPLIGLTAGELDQLGPIGSLRIQDMVEECLSTGQTIKHLLSFEETGAGLALDVTVKPILDNERIIRYCIVEAHDVTKLMRLTNNLEQQVEERTSQIRMAQQQLIESEKMASLGRLVAGIAHEINTPVGVAKTGTTYLKEQVTLAREQFDKDTLTREDLLSALESFAEASDILDRNLDRAVKLIRDFRMTAADQSSREERPVRVREYIEAIMHSLSPEMKKLKVQWHVEAPDEEIPLHIGAINQILMNFTMNSVNHGFSEGTGGSLNILYRRTGARRILVFTDDGKGVSPEIRDKIFEPFFTTGRGKGFTGLGLSIVYNLVKDVLNGELECISEEGKGTTFRIVYGDRKSP